MSRPQSGLVALEVRPVERRAAWNPWTEMDRMHRQLDVALGSPLGFTPLSRLVVTGEGKESGTLTYNLYETPEEWVLVAPLPGVNPEELSIEATAENLTIRGEYKPVYQNENATLRRHAWGATEARPFEAIYTLPEAINPEGVQAQFRYGVLELHLPKPEAQKPKTIKVNVESL